MFQTNQARRSKLDKKKEVFETRWMDQVSFMAVKKKKKKGRLKFLNYKLFKSWVASGDGKKLKRKFTLAKKKEKETQLAKKIFLFFFL